MVYLAKKDGGVVHHTSLEAMKQMDGIEKPDMEISDEEFEAAGCQARIINGKIFIGKTDEEKQLARTPYLGGNLLIHAIKELKKVNYGKDLLLRAFGINGRTETIGVGEGTAARVNFFECLKNLGSLGVKSIDDKLLADIKAELKITEKPVENDSENVEVDNSQPKQPEWTAEDTALSRRTIRKVFDMIIAKDANFKKNANLENMIIQSKVYGF